MRWFLLAAVLLVAGCSADRATAESAVRRCIAANPADLGLRIGTGDVDATTEALERCAAAITSLETEFGDHDDASTLVLLISRRVDVIGEAKFTSAQHQFALLTARTQQQCRLLGADAPTSLHCELFPDTGPALDQFAVFDPISNTLDAGHAEWLAKIETALGALAGP